MQKLTSILKIKKNIVQKEFSFYFDFISKDKISNEIRNLDKTKSGQENDIPVKNYQ